MKVGFSTVAGTRGGASSSTTPALTSTASCCWTTVASWGGRQRLGEQVRELGVVRAMIRRKADVPRCRQMLYGERSNYGMLAYESAGR